MRLAAQIWSLPPDCQFSTVWLAEMAVWLAWSLGVKATGSQIMLVERLLYVSSSIGKFVSILLSLEQQCPVLGLESSEKTLKN